MNRTTIGIDARELLGARTGVGRYLGELLTRWIARSDADRRRFVLYAPEPLEMVFPTAQVSVRVLPGGRGTWWEQTSLASAVRRDALSVFFAPAYTAPLSVSAPFAVTIHDVSFSRHPEWFRWREGLRRRLLTARAARRAAVVLTVSEFSKHEIQDLYGVPPDKIVVVPNGVSRLQSPAASREPLVLYVGSIFNRRRVPDLIAAFAQVVRIRPDARLVIVGEDRTWPPQDLGQMVRSLGVSASVSLRAHVTDAELADLYARAGAFAFLSEYEGFGLTPLEAVSAGIAPVVLDTPVAREVYGDAAIFLPRGNITAIAETLTALLVDSRVTSSVLEKAPPVLSRYSWDAAADATLRAIESVMRR